jgi:hypothetical protein
MKRKAAPSALDADFETASAGFRGCWYSVSGPHRAEAVGGGFSDHTGWGDWWRVFGPHRAAAVGGGFSDHTELRRLVEGFRTTQGCGGWWRVFGPHRLGRLVEGFRTTPRLRLAVVGLLPCRRWLSRFARLRTTQAGAVGGGFPDHTEAEAGGGGFAPVSPMVVSLRSAPDHSEAGAVGGASLPSMKPEPEQEETEGTERQRGIL